MVKMLNAYTLEVDDIEFAVEEVLGQLDLENSLLAHSGGVLTCHADFIETGVVEALCKALPFGVVGCTTLSNGIQGQNDSLMLALSVLTSDDVEITAGRAEHVTGGSLSASMEAAYAAAMEGVAQKSALALAFAPTLEGVGGEEFILALSASMPGTPIFGTLACNHTFNNAPNRIIYNGDSQPDAIAFLLLCGDVKPGFSITSISPGKVQKQRGIITDSQGGLLRTVNNMPTAQYLESMGIIRHGDAGVMANIPFLVDYNDGSEALARAIYYLTPEGWAVCGAAMPQGSSLAVGSLTRDDVLHTAKKTVDKALADEPNAVFFCSCITRNLVLGTDTAAEMDAVDEAVAGRAPYQMFYSGGEICPVYGAQNAPVNRFHNFTLVVCTL